MTVAGWIVTGIMCAAIIAMFLIAAWLEDYHPPDEDGSPNWTVFQQDLNSTYIVDKLQAAESALLNDFYAFVGIPNIQFEKSERLTRSESAIDNYATQCLVALWKRTITASLEKVNSMFGLNVSVDYNETLLKELENRGNVNNDNGGGDAQLSK